MEIKYQIEFLSDWHIGSGLDAGADADNIVLKDDDQLPFIPGKTLKGLLKDAADEICAVGKADKKLIDKIFGGENKDGSTFQGNAFFNNAELPEEVKKEIKANNLQEFLYRNIASTAIERKTGVAKKNSLRTIQVTIPLTLSSSIIINEEVEGIEELMEQTFKWLRYIGVNRNRGLGRCRITKLSKN
jgi:CRISPR/Cas system CSM-associated protein Csm3 (group 7 of RAMP superfamily)